MAATIDDLGKSEDSVRSRKAKVSGSDSTMFTQLKTREPKTQEDSSTRSFVLLALIFIGALIALGIVYLNFPELEEHEKQYIRLPRDIEDAKKLGNILSVYKENNFYQVLGGVFITYIFLQSFAIPGSIFLSILSGFLFPFPLALFLVCLCSATGASFCYLLSFLVGRRLVQKYIPDRVADWQNHVDRHKQHLLNYLIFLRITPFLPNWFINIASPVINVPLLPFFIGTFVGVAPPSFVAIHAGTTLHQLTSSGDAISSTSIIILAVLAILSLLPVLFKKKLGEKFD
ncbi:hypothetical protein ACJMK2_021145 [Sinanodonta woodiana]|uniref:VTT domain-containing protein n=1 Tax=Sinanodonta woodiana TaxID=1069815 RepID=A0ABD3U1Q4_SINWO